ncbi:MAG: peptide deformylase [Bacteroidales bacterium]|nr:peptide deformylase [Bacteroidales bacterium]
MVYPIVVYGSPVLRQVAKEIDRNYSGLEQLIADMFETMYESDGMGLAAPQIGKSIRLFIMDLTSLEEEDASLKDFRKVFINAKIVEYEGDTWIMNEGCLSFPLLKEDVERKNRIRIQYYDENWEFHDEIMDGYKARVVQHEYDHINGILFIDLIPPLRKKLIKGKLNDITRCKVDVSYQIRLMK